MRPAEFEERAYEAPLYNQLERGERNIFTPGQVLEAEVGFDRAIDLAEHAVWDTMGYRTPPVGISLGHPRWAQRVVRKQDASKLPRFRLNLFIQAKRPNFHTRPPRAVRSQGRLAGPCWEFRITHHQQKLLEKLQAKARSRAHVTYASPAFDTYVALFRHTRSKTIVANSTFPSAQALAGHERWYYSEAGAQGVANPSVEAIKELPLLERLAALAGGEQESLTHAFVPLAEDVLATSQEIEPIDERTARFANDLLTLDRLMEPMDLNPTFRAYAQIMLFVADFDLTWLIYGTSP